MLTGTLKEPRCDILAQLRATADSASPKQATFIHKNSGPETFDTPIGCFRVARADGTLITRRQDLVDKFVAADSLTERIMADILGYPQAKSDLPVNDTIVTVQVLDGNGCVLQEFAVVEALLPAVTQDYASYIPEGGSMRFVSIASALLRREMKNRGFNGF